MLKIKINTLHYPEGAPIKCNVFTVVIITRFVLYRPASACLQYDYTEQLSGGADQAHRQWRSWFCRRHTGCHYDSYCHVLQDVIQFNPLMRTMGAQIIQDPAFVPQLMMHVGPVALADWMMHVGALGAFTALNVTAAPPLKLLAGSKALPSRVQYALRRTLDAWEFGSGADFKL